MEKKPEERLIAHKRVSFTPSERKRLNDYCQANRIEASFLIRELVRKHLNRSKPRKKKNK